MKEQTSKKDEVLESFFHLLHESQGSVLIHFVDNEKNKEKSRKPFVEVLEPGTFQWVRHFELDIALCQAIIAHYSFPTPPTAAIFDQGKTTPHYYGYRNVRKYLRTCQTS